MMLNFLLVLLCVFPSLCLGIQFSLQLIDPLEISYTISVFKLQMKFVLIDILAIIFVLSYSPYQEIKSFAMELCWVILGIGSAPVTKLQLAWHLMLVWWLVWLLDYLACRLWIACLLNLAYSGLIVSLKFVASFTPAYWFLCFVFLGNWPYLHWMTDFVFLVHHKLGNTIAKNEIKGTICLHVSLFSEGKICNSFGIYKRGLTKVVPLFKVWVGLWFKFLLHCDIGHWPTIE